MPLEIRQMVIKSTVGNPQDPGQAGAASEEQAAQIKAEILEECRAWFLEQMRLRQER